MAPDELDRVSGKMLMKTRSVLNLALLCSAPLACTDADAPPPKAAIYFAASPAATGSCGIDSTRPTSLPPTATRIGVAGPATSDADLDAMDKMEDGADDASVSCELRENAPGAYDVNVTIRYRDVLFSLTGTSANFQGTGSVRYKSITTGNQTYESSTCTMSLSKVPEGGGAGLLQLQCTGLQYSHMPDSLCDANGVVLLRDCSN